MVRLSGAVVLRGRLSAPWAISAPDAVELARAVAPGARRLVPFHLVAEGRCSIGLEGRHVELTKGTIAFLPDGGSHTLASGDARNTVPIATLIATARRDTGLPVVEHGGGGEPTRIVCGFMRCDEVLFDPLLDSLPGLLRAETTLDADRSLLSATARHLVAEAEATHAGGACLLARLAELLFIEVLRRHIAEQPPAAIGWLGALHDPLVGRALQLLHAEPARRWTVAELARRAGASRSRLAAGFKARLALPPMRYLASWRVQLSTQWLRDQTLGLAAIAERIGYESEAAFNRAFKRHTGQPPGAWRVLTTRCEGAAAASAAPGGPRRSPGARRA